MSDVPAKPDPLKELLDRLVPPREVRIRDLLDNEYVLPGVISARRNVEVVRHLQAVLAEPAARRAALQIGAALEGGDIGEMVLHVVGIVTSTEIIDHVSAAFVAAHPGALAEARVNASSPTADAADLFAIEEIATALLPLFVGLAKRSVHALHGVSGVVMSNPAR